MIQTYEELLGALNSHRVSYIVVGGLAVALNGFIRMTEDVDILVDNSATNIARLLDCLSHFGGGSARELTVDDFTKEEGAISVREDFPLDIFTIMRGIDYSEAVKTQKILHAEIGDIPFLSKELLLVLKSNSRREKDQIDVAALKASEIQPVQINDLQDRIERD